ncbi:hypothetical protein MNBD_NITROSPINAE02-1002 [hydrothermal vent metagenome]|uniref:Uncharacterized protein n=1 Tax=hydrothermal vent metagenome TaxID=652676 RepID=A0A3B1D3M0_9ZZZZ
MSPKYTKALLAFVILLIVTIPFGLEYYTSQPSFCGSCHIMKKYYATWEKSKHRNIACVECHYAPGQQHTLTAKFKGLSQLFSYLATSGTEVRKKTRIDDSSCSTSNCHPLDEKFNSKKIKFTDKVSYVHKTHFDKTIEGQKLHCSTCHQHRSSSTHFEVPQENCFLCHFKNTGFNEGRGKCVLCHEMTDKPLQKQFENGGGPAGVKPITHKSLKEAGVLCTSCHIELIRGNGDIKEENCLDCHEAGEDLAKAQDKKLMHSAHVAKGEIDCHNCHTPIVHKETEDILEIVRSQCALCHPDHHLYQKALLTGEAVEGVASTPGLMSRVKTNCLACHTKEDTDKKGQKILRGSPEACVACHTKEHNKMLAEWKTTIAKELNFAKESEAKAAQMIARSKGKKQGDEIAEANKALAKGRHFLQIIEYGHGVHNRKYSIMLIDEALNNFDEIIDNFEDE